MFHGSAIFPSHHRENALIRGFLALVTEDLASHGGNP